VTKSNKNYLSKLSARNDLDDLLPAGQPKFPRELVLDGLNISIGTDYRSACGARKLGDRVAELRQIGAVIVMKNLQNTLHGESRCEVASAGDHLREGLELSLHPIHEFRNSDVIRERSWTNAELVQ
jgi:hypothetical protein